MTTDALIQSTPTTLVTVYVKTAEVWDHDQEGIINTPQGARVAKKGDFVITAVSGERYVCPAHRYMPDMEFIQGRTCVMLDVSDPADKQQPKSIIGGKF